MSEIKEPIAIAAATDLRRYSVYWFDWLGSNLPHLLPSRIPKMTRMWAKCYVFGKPIEFPQKSTE
jgi:hypothetical protein